MADQYVKLPDGSWAQFPDGMTPEEIQAKLKPVLAQIATTMPPVNPEPTVRGVIENADAGTGITNFITSGLKLGKNLLWDMPVAFGKLAALDIEMRDPGTSPQRRKQLVDDAKATMMAMPGAVKDEIVKSYGSWGRAMQTLYEDPFRVIGDVASLAGGAGMLAKAGGLSRTASVLNTASKLDPTMLAIQGAAKVANEGGKGAILATLRPGQALKADFDVTGRQIAERVQQAGVTDLTAARKAEQALVDTEEATATTLGRTDPRRMDPGVVIDELDVGEPRGLAESLAKGGSEKEEVKLNKTIDVMKRRNARKPPPAAPEPPRAPVEVVDEGSAPITETVLDDVAEAAPEPAPRTPLQLEDRIIYSAGQDGRVGPRLLNPAPPGIAEPGTNIELHQRGTNAGRQNVPPSSATGEPIPLRGEVPVNDEAMTLFDRPGGIGESADAVDEATGLVRRPVRLGARGGRPAGEPVQLYEGLDPLHALRNKRAAQMKAYDAGKKSQGFNQTLERTKARKYREEIAEVWPEMADTAQATQEGMSVTKAFEQAAARPDDLMPKLVATALAAGPTAAMAGGPAGLMAGAGAFGVAALSQSPKVGAMLGVGAHRAHNFMMNPKLLRLAQTMRAAGAQKDEIDAAVERAALEDELARSPQGEF